MADNKFILTGYRINFTTCKRICRSFCMLHNETINVWSHLTGVGFFICLLVYVILSLDSNAEYFDLEGNEYKYYVTKVPLYLHICSAIFCLGSSTIFHFLKDFSETISYSLSRLDYGGISILIAGSNIPPIYYAFFCPEMLGILILKIDYSISHFVY